MHLSELGKKTHIFLKIIITCNKYVVTCTALMTSRWFDMSRAVA